MMNLLLRCAILSRTGKHSNGGCRRCDSTFTWSESFALVLMLSFSCALIGCTEQSSESVHLTDSSILAQGLSTPCSDEGIEYDHCGEIDMTQVLLLSEALDGEMPWRRVTDTDSGYHIVVDPEQFNEGFMLVEYGQGFYSTIDEFVAYSEYVLGAPLNDFNFDQEESGELVSESQIDDYEKDNPIGSVVDISIVSESTKVWQPEPGFYEVAPGDTGDFYLNAVSDAYGQIHIGGQTYDVSGQSLNLGQLATALSGCSSSRTSSDGPYESCLKFNDYGSYQRAKLGPFHRYGSTTVRRCDGWLGRCRNRRVEADEKKMRNVYASTTYARPNWPWLRWGDLSFQVQNNTTSISRGLIMNNVRPACSRTGFKEGNYEDMDTFTQTVLGGDPSAVCSFLR